MVEGSGVASFARGNSLVRVGDIVAEKYRVDGLLGQGGMGVVMSAHHLKLEKRVALKFLHPSYAENPEAAERFLREAQNATAIQSEHVVRVMDVGAMAHGPPYMVMEYLDGRDLGALLQERGPLPIAEAVDYLLQSMEALAEAHSLGMVHRDLKPSNLFLTARADGSPLVKVLDFGISKVASAARELTQANGIMGSPLYMSPEHIRSAKDADARSDIWSLGVILYALVAGRAPFARTEITEIVAAVITEPPPPLHTARPDVPEELERVILRCLAKEPEARFQSLAPMARALETFGLARSQLSVERIVGVALRSAATKKDEVEVRALAEPNVHSGATWLLGEEPVGARSKWSTAAIVAAAVLSASVAVWLVVRSREPVLEAVPISPPRTVALPAPPPPPPAIVAPAVVEPAAPPPPTRRSSKRSSIDELIEDRR